MEGKCKIKPAEFFDIAAQQGFYGLERGGLTGKKDYVRKYWEDIAIKLTVRNSIEKLLTKRNDIRVIDLGCGSGEGFELLTRISVPCCGFLGKYNGTADCLDSAQHRDVLRTCVRMWARVTMHSRNH
jgi:hypothetical protein